MLSRSLDNVRKAQQLVESAALVDQQKSVPQRAQFSGPLRKVITGIAFFVTICVTAVFGYVAAGWQVANSIYMVIITIFGVG